MHALGEHVDAQRADQVAAQRRRAPQLFVVAALGVEADDQRRRAEAAAQRIDVVREVGTAAFLAGLDQDHAARMRHTLLAQCTDGRQRGEEGVAVVGAAAAIELAVAQHRASTARDRPTSRRTRVACRGDRTSVRSRRPRPARRPSARACARAAAGPPLGLRAATALRPRPNGASAAPRPPCGRGLPSPGRTWATCSGCGRTRSAPPGSIPASDGRRSPGSFWCP